MQLKNILLSKIPETIMMNLLTNSATDNWNYERLQDEFDRIASIQEEARRNSNKQDVGVGPITPDAHSGEPSEETTRDNRKKGKYTVCFNCLGKGHVAKECRNPTYRCPKCGKKGHNEDSYVVIEQSQRPGSFRATVEALVDCGASLSTIPMCTQAATSCRCFY
eukprot:GHVS01019056.1.p1 GENE.GHVS01019056.1~~GHVS01019056.1.p1  ORF type:complete len:164 (-),score=4.15 GHVS01019056.1:530-1021(-)